MDQTIIGDDIGHREHPGVPLVGEHVGTGAGQRPGRPDQLLVHAVHPLDDPADAGQVEPGPGSRREHARGPAGGDQRPHRVRVDLDVRVEVQAREGAGLRVTQAHRVRLSGYRRLDDADAGYRPGHLGGTVGACVRDDDDVELAGYGTGEQPAQVARDDGFLVVRRYDDAHGRLAHAAQDNRRTDGMSA